MPQKRQARLACVLAVVVVTASSAISNALYSGESADTHVRVAAADTSSRAQSVRDDSATSGTAPVATGAAQAAQAPDTVKRPVVRTMSMDAPIQGGLTAHQEQALSARLISAHQDAGVAQQDAHWTPAMGRTAVARAESWLGMPYSWAGGDSTGPTTGRCDPGSGGDLDCHVVGFDCSGLMMYAWGAYLSLPHLADSQRSGGEFHPTVEQLLPGDLVFFSGYLPNGTGHVAIYAGDGQIIEAPQSGQVLTRSTLAAAMAEDGAYRGAVRPLTEQTPTLAAGSVSVPTAGGTVTLRGQHLDGVDTVHVANRSIRAFSRHTDSVIEFRAPAHRTGTVSVTVSTSWRATSAPAGLRYTQPRRATPKPPPSTAPVSTSPVRTPPSGTPKPTPPVSTAPPSSTPTPPVVTPTPKPTPTTSASSAPKSTAPKATAPSQAGSSASPAAQTG